MTKTVVLGSGIVGRAAAWDLSRRGHHVLIADAATAAAQRVGSELQVEWTQLDVNDDAAVDAVLIEADCVVSAVPYVFGERLARAAIRTGTHYFDFGGNPTIVKRQLEMDAGARAAGVAVVPDCGLAPGYANVIAAGMIADAPQEGASVQIRVGVLPQQPTGTLNYQLAFYAGGLINEYAEPCEVIAGGKAVTVEPLDRLETLTWDGIGDLEAFSTAGGTSTMCQEYAGKVQALEYKTIRYPGHGVIFRAFRELGFFATVPRGNNGAPRDLLLDLLTENLPSGAPDITLVDVSVTAPGYSRERRLEDRHDGRFSSLARTTAFPTTALCHLVASGVVDFTGVAAMHSIGYADSLEAELEPLGLVADDR